uniref:Protein TOPAZ1 n=1 Tax=Taenia asiatica TaxID=60517 RepID=A0A0R3WD50_TAEAS
MQRHTSLSRLINLYPNSGHKTAQMNSKNASNHKKRHLPLKSGEKSLHVKVDEKFAVNHTSSSSRPAGTTKLTVGKKDAHLNREIRASRIVAIKSKFPRKNPHKLASNSHPRRISCSGGSTKKRPPEPKAYHEKIVHESRAKKAALSTIPKILVTLVESESWQSSSSTTQRRVLYTHSGDSMETQAEVTDTDEAIGSGQTSDTLDSLECFTDSQNEMMGSQDHIRLEVQDCRTNGEAERDSGTGKGHYSNLITTTSPDSLYYEIKSTFLSGCTQNQNLAGLSKAVYNSELNPSGTKIGALPSSNHEELSWIGWNSANWHCQNTQPPKRWRNIKDTMNGSGNKYMPNKYPLKVESKPISNRCNLLVHTELLENKHVFMPGQTQPCILVDAFGENDEMKVIHMNKTQSGEEDLSGSGSRAIISQATHTQTSVTIKKEVEIGAGAECHQADREPSTVGSLPTLPPFTLPEHCTYIDGLVGDEGSKIACSPSHKAELAGILTTERYHDKLSLPNENVHLQRSEVFTPEMNKNGCDEDHSTICGGPLLMLTNSKFAEVENSSGIAPERVQGEMREDAIKIEGQIPRKRMISIRTKNLPESQKRQMLLSPSWKSPRITESLDSSPYAACLEHKKCLFQAKDFKTPLTQQIVPFCNAYVKQWSLSEESVHTAVELNPHKAVQTVISPSEGFIPCLEKNAKSNLLTFNKESITPLTSVAACSRTLQSSMQKEAFSTNVSAHPFNFTSHRSSRTILLPKQSISLTSVSSFESEVPLPGGPLNAIKQLKEEVEEEGRAFDKKTTLRSNVNRSQYPTQGGNENLGFLDNFVEVYYDVSLCMTRAGPIGSRDVPAAVKVLIDLDQSTFAVPDLNSSVVTSDSDNVTLERDIQNAGSRKFNFKRKKKNDKCERMIQFPQGDRQKPHAPNNLTSGRNHTRTSRKYFTKVSKAPQRKYQVSRLPMLSLDGISPEMIPHLSKEYLSSSTDTLRYSRKATEASKEVCCSKHLVERPSAAFHFISPKKTQCALFEKHIAQIKRPSSWNCTVFAGPKRVGANFERIKKRQAMAYEKKVYQLSAARVLNGNNNASTRMEHPHDFQRGWKSMRPKLKFRGQNCGMTCWDFFWPHKFQNHSRLVHMNANFGSYDKVAKLRPLLHALRRYQWKYLNQRLLLQSLTLSFEAKLKYFTQSEEFFSTSYTFALPTTNQPVQPESLDTADQEKIILIYPHDFYQVKMEGCELSKESTPGVYNFPCFQKRSINSKLTNGLKMKKNVFLQNIPLTILGLSGIKKNLVFNFSSTIKHFASTRAPNVWTTSREHLGLSHILLILVSFLRGKKTLRRSIESSHLCVSVFVCVCAVPTWFDLLLITSLIMSSNFKRQYQQMLLLTIT